MLKDDEGVEDKKWEMNMDTIKLIPSKDVRDFCIKMGHEFPDFEKAILIYHLEIEDQEKNRLLTRFEEDLNC